MGLMEQVESEISRLVEELQQLQAHDGSWRFCFESGPLTDAYMIILLRTLNESHHDQHETLIKRLADRIASLQNKNGAWKLYHEEERGNLSATVESYYALLMSGYHKKTDAHMQKARQFILSAGGLEKAGSLTKVILSVTGQCPWPRVLIPVEAILLPPSAPLSFYDFVGYARVHIAPILIAADRSFTIQSKWTPDLSDLYLEPPSTRWNVFDNLQPPADSRSFVDTIKKLVYELPNLPQHIHQTSLDRLEQFMLERIESDGTLYSYASATFFMVFALLALGYPKTDPVITRAIHGLTTLACQTDGQIHLQNSTSTVWDSALISYALQEAGVHPTEPTIEKATQYLLSRQQNRTGDWAIRDPDTPPGGWGFSDINTINPDVDDTTAALRAIRGTRTTPSTTSLRHAWDQGLNWVLSMQNADGGWPAFEKNTDQEILTWLPIDGADSAFVDPSTSDLTGRTLEFLGRQAGLTTRHAIIRRAVEWLLEHQKEDGSWHGRWGISHLYGTWAALTGMMAIGVSSDHLAVRQAEQWLEKIQNPDGGWGESCASDIKKRYIPLGVSTRSQTAWAVDALIAVAEKPTPAIERGIQFLLASAHRNDWTTKYPTGAGLPGGFYVRYHSYRYIWPLLTLAHYKAKFGA